MQKHHHGWNHTHYLHPLLPQIRIQRHGDLSATLPPKASISFDPGASPPNRPCCACCAPSLAWRVRQLRHPTGTRSGKRWRKGGACGRFGSTFGQFKAVWVWQTHCFENYESTAIAAATAAISTFFTETTSFCWESCCWWWCFDYYYDCHDPTTTIIFFTEWSREGRGGGCRRGKRRRR